MSDETEMRGSGRRRVLKAGRLIFNNKSSVADCVVRRIGDTGADVRLEGPIALPDDLMLIMDEKHFNARRVWQEGLNVGLEFL
jgi:hypothetical protein